MKRSPDETIPVWREAQHHQPAFPKLRQDTEADVCVIGAGIAGLTTAYLLQKEGKSVVVLDAYGLAAGETGRTTAHLSAVLDDRFSHLESLFGTAGARLAADSHRAAIDRIESIVHQERIDCDFERVTGYLVAMDDKQRRALENEFAAVPRAGFYEAEGFPEVPLANIVDTGSGLMFPGQAMFHPARYMIGMAKAYSGLGGRIFVGAHVRSATGGAGAYIETDEGLRVSARHIVVATNTPINDRVTMHTKQAAYRSYAVAFGSPKNSYPGFLLWDLEDSHMAERYRRLEEWTRHHFSGVGEARYRWSGQIMEPVDSLAFIGRNPGDDDNLYIATGDSGHGMTHGTIAGMLIRDLIQKRPNPWAALYDPSRKTPRSATTFVSENLNVAARMLKDWVKPSEVDNVEQIARGEGAILRQGASKIAVYRDAQGAIHARSAVCTHLGCIVQWNTNEKSWDCPCHGSRYDIEGRVLNGPAVSPLSPAEIGSAGDGQRDQRDRAHDDPIPGEDAKAVPADEVH